MALFTGETFTHKNNPTGTTVATVASSQVCSPVDPLAREWAQAYPIERLYLARQMFTEYTALVAGDMVVVDSVTYAVKAVHKYDAQGGMDAYYHVILEQQSGA